MNRLPSLEGWRRKVAPLALVVALGGCATTFEGVVTAECVDGTAEYSLKPGQKIYLGDVSGDTDNTDSETDDWFQIENKNGSLQFDSEDGHVLGQHGDNGRVSGAEGGFDYSENDNTYEVRYKNSNDINGTVDVTITSVCE